MPIITKDQSQDKASRKLDKALHKKTKRKPLHEEDWSDLHQRGASLAEQYEWIRLRKKQIEKYMWRATRAERSAVKLGNTSPIGQQTMSPRKISGYQLY